MATYRDQWRDPRWQKKRLEVMEDAGWECENCGTKEVTLNVHHKRYVKGRKVWEYEREELACLCEICHEEEHADRDLLARLLSEGERIALDVAIGVTGGYLDATCSADPGLCRMAYEEREPYFELGLVTAAMEYEGPDVWRGYIRDFVKRHPSCPPSFRSAVEYWDDWEKERIKLPAKKKGTDGASS